MANHSESTDEWDVIIEPRFSWWDLRLAEVWQYRDLLSTLVHRNFVAQYKQTILGPVWFFIQPMLTTLTFMVIFGSIANIPTDGIPQPLFYLSGIVIWSYFSDCLVKTSTVFKDNAGVFGKVYFPRLIMPLSIILSNLIKFALQSLLFVIVLIYYLVFRGDSFELHITPYIWLLPVFLLLMATLGLSLGMIISALTTKYRDLAFLVSFGVQLLMYATPVVYPLSSERVRSIAGSFLQWNPLAPILEGVRKGLFGQGFFEWWYLGYACAVSFVLLLLAVVIYNRVEKTFIDTV
ncbi:MAG: ABC transporter permease [Flavobacteriales bacterium]